MGEDGQALLSRGRPLHVRCQGLVDSNGVADEAPKPPSYFDVAPKLYEANPPPGTYEAKGA